MNGRVFFSRRPNPKKQTPAQRATRDNFRHASVRAKGIMADPARRAPYEARAKSEGRPLRQLIIADFLARKSESEPSLIPPTGTAAV